MAHLAELAELAPYAETIDLAHEAGALSPWAPRAIPVERFRVKALTTVNLEAFCHVLFRNVETARTLYEGSKFTREISTDTTNETIIALEMLRIGLIAYAEHTKQPTEHLLAMDLSGIETYYKRNRWTS